MHKNLGIIFFISGNNISGMEKYDSLNKRMKDFFMWVVARCDGDLFAAALRKDKAMLYFKISKPTYYSWLKKLIDVNLMKKRGQGLYEINKQYAKIITKADKELADAVKNF
jgi:DNA-binding transcriptional ArsR family regulator